MAEKSGTGKEGDHSGPERERTSCRRDGRWVVWSETGGKSRAEFGVKKGRPKISGSVEREVLARVVGRKGWKEYAS